MSNYLLKNLSYVKDNKEEFIRGAHLAHERFMFTYGKPFNQMSSTWFYRYYNLTTLTVGSPLYYKLFVDLQKSIREYANNNDPLWYQCWLNFHDENEVLTRHNHPDCLFHGFISIDPKDTETEFEDYTITNETGNLYIGDAGVMHQVNVLSSFEGKRITIAFDIEDEHNFKKHMRDIVDVNTGFIPVPNTSFIL